MSNQTPLSVWVYNSERYFTQLCVACVPRENVLEYLFEVHDIHARLCTDFEILGILVKSDQVYIRLI